MNVHQTPSRVGQPSVDRHRAEVFDTLYRYESMVAEYTKARTGSRVAECTSRCERQAEWYDRTFGRARSKQKVTLAQFPFNKRLTVSVGLISITYSQRWRSRHHETSSMPVAMGAARMPGRTLRAATRYSPQVQDSRRR